MKERDLIEIIQDQYLEKTQFLSKGIGDDCAVISGTPNLCWLVTTDLLVENVHFSLKYSTPLLLGRKSVAVNLSDIAAMGGDPQFVLISLSIPSHIGDRWLKSWYSGVRSMLKEHHCTLIGGDTAKGGELTINIVALGTAVPDKVLYRGGASPGQDIYVTGPLGSSAAGLELLQRNYTTESKEYSTLIEAHLNPIPQVEQGKFIGESGLATAMQDLSDGLSTDMSHICKASNIGAEIFSEKLPFDGALEDVCNIFQKDKYQMILSGGEDYQLVFTANQNNRKNIQDLFDQNKSPLYRIGQTREKRGVELIFEDGTRKDITFQGYEHTS